MACKGERAPVSRASEEAIPVVLGQERNQLNTQLLVVELWGLSGLCADSEYVDILTGAL